MEGDSSYFTRRASEERAAALNAASGAARVAHEQMAERYEDLVRAIARHDHRTGVDLADVA